MSLFPKWLILFPLLLSLSFSSSAKANSGDTVLKSQSRPQEVFLSFNYRNLFNKVIIAYYEDGKFYLPVSELLTILKIPHQADLGSLSLTGTYLDPSNSFTFDFRESRYNVQIDSKGAFTFGPNQMLVKELDFYTDLEVFAKVFDLNFSVDLNNLLLQLQTPHTLPIVEEFEREKRRQRQDQFALQKDYYPLEYEREWSLFGGGFLDYSLSANVSEEENIYSYNLDLGTEILGGDFQGSALGSYSGDFSTFTTNNTRWRYVFRNNNYLTQFYAGQTGSDGLVSRNFTGIRLTNEPIEPRFLYDSYEVEGETEPGSEVELYYNDALYDFTRTTETGRYRFLAPLTYGSSRLRLRIYDPSGGITERRQRIQIPFSFLPSGEFSYHLNAGRLDNPIFGSTEKGNILQGDVSYGVSNWFTQKAGFEYLSSFSGQTPLLYSASSARILDQYLLNADIAPSAFYRFSGNVIYPSAASLNLNYTYFTGSGIYNPLNFDQEFSGNIFIPFKAFDIPFNVRVLGSHATKEFGSNSSYNINLNSRFNRLNLRISYKDRQTDRFSLEPGLSSNLSASATYLISRKPNIPRYLQNTFLRGQIDYNPGLSRFEQAEIQGSRSIFEIGRIQASFTRNFLGDFNFFNVGLTIDFNAFRSTSTFRNIRNSSSLTQNVRGSIGFDDFSSDLIFSNRPQVGRSATSVRLYVDSNNSGTYDENDELINDEAVRIGRAGTSSSTQNGVLRFSQLQAYHRINMEINEAAIKNPFLVPDLQEFSIVTDPNQYKPINIPFYISGIIEGKVQRVTENSNEPLSGVRLFLKAVDKSFETEVQTFSDGSFYIYEVPPGRYELRVDSTQLSFLDAVSKPEKIFFEIKSISGGDYIQDLTFLISPTDTEPVTADDRESITSVPADREEGTFLLQVGSYKYPYNAYRAHNMAEHFFSRKFFIKYNPLRGLYAVRAMPVNSRLVAKKQYLAALDSPFEELALVEINDPSVMDTVVISDFFVQLGAFKSGKKANKFADFSNDRLNIPVKTFYDEKMGLYIVRSKMLESGTEAEKTLHEIKKTDPLYRKAFIKAPDTPGKHKSVDFNYLIRIEGLRNAEEHESYKNSIREIKSPSISFSSESLPDVLIIENIPSWEQTLKLKRRLDEMFFKTAVNSYVVLIQKTES